MLEPLRRAVAAFSLVVVVAGPNPLAAHAIIMSSTPSRGGVIEHAGKILLHFNSRIDHARSRLVLVGPGTSSRSLEISGESPLDGVLAAAPGLPAGEYRLQWQVLALDGHITRGELPFRSVAR